MNPVITRVQLRYEQDVVYARFRARIIAEQLGFDTIDQTRISTAVSEIARNAFQYAGGGEIEFLVDMDKHPQIFGITVKDHGKGILRLDEVLEGKYISETGLGLGIVGAKRLMDQLRIDSHSGGTTVFLSKNLPITAPHVTPAVLSHIADVLAKTAARNPFEEIRLQNQDLIHALEALRESEERFQLAVNVTEDGLWERDILTGKEFFSPRWCEILGYSSDDPELLHTHNAWIERIHPADSERVMSALKNHFEKSTKYDIDYRHRHKSGEYRWQNSKGQAVFDASGKPVKMIGVINDITERKKADEILKDFNKKLQQGIEEKTAKLRESELRHLILFESSRDAIMTLEPPDWRFTSGNSATLAMFRAKDEAGFTSAAPWDLSPECQPDGQPSREKALEQIEKAVREGSHFFEWTHKRMNGEEFPATVLMTRFEWKEKKILQATVRDITEQKHAEDKIKTALDEKVHLLNEIHHRVNNNLQIIISLVNLQMRQIDDERLKQVLAETQNRVRAMSFVHEKLYQSEDISHIDLANYTRYLVTRLFSFYGVDSRHVALNIDIGKIMLNIETSIPLGLIINELASNALKHAFSHERKGTLSLTIRKEDSTLYLTIKDDGTGFPANFDWRNAESVGLKLVILLVEQLDGTIEVDRSSGTVFTIVVKEKE
jgi:PAS domain S-box-containing protein